EVNMMTLAQIVSKIFNKKVEIKSIEYPSFYPQGDPKRRSPDLTKIRTMLGYEPKINLEIGLKRTLQWYQERNGSAKK
ncbi:MAG: SDR family NAD-dependent epimerase/dehydratase, partial [bacterium]|nr:SDR family NAD-dependent epimerase/dehydratase [bacterium]